MRHPPPISPLFTTPSTTMPSSLSTKPHPHNHRNKPLSTSPTPSHNPPATASATLDLILLTLALISITFLITSSLSSIFTSLSHLLPSYSLPSPHLLALTLALALLLAAALSFSFRGRKCGRPTCKGLKKALQFDLQLQTEEMLKNGSKRSDCNGVVDVERLPWKGGSEGNPDYECLRAELRKMAPPNGRAVLLFRAKCGCPVSKLVGWGPKKPRKHKKALSTVTVNGAHR